MAWLQFCKHSPINFRNFMAVPKLVNPKAVSLCLRSFLLMDRAGDAELALDKLVGARVRVSTPNAAAWGYPFDWEARAFSIRAGTPNLICTAYSVRAIAAAAKRGAIKQGLAGEIIIDAARFVADNLLRRRPDGKSYVAYVPATDAVIHNVTAWGAYIFAEAARITGQKNWRDKALATADTVIQAQTREGFWHYGERSHHRFVDGFHTGYILEALTCIEDRLECRFNQAIVRGLDDYQNHFFSVDGRPFYYRNDLFPLDCHAAAQGALTFFLVRSSDEHECLAQKILQWAIRDMWNSKEGYFRYQRNGYWTNSINYFRWTQAWMLLALTTAQAPDLARQMM
jgi:hypothetical protein